MIALLQAYETWLYEKQYKAAMEDLYSDNQMESITAQDMTLYKRLQIMISGPRYELGMNILTILNVVIVFLRSYSEEPKKSNV